MVVVNQFRCRSFRVGLRLGPGDLTRPERMVRKLAVVEFTWHELWLMARRRPKKPDSPGLSGSSSRTVMGDHGRGEVRYRIRMVNDAFGRAEA